MKRHVSSRYRKERVAIYGAGPGGKTLKESIELTNKYKVYYFIDDDENLVGSSIEGIPVISGNDLKKLKKKSIFNIATEIASSEFRLKLREKLKEQGFDLINVIHPNSYIASSAKLGVGNFIKSGAVIGTHTRIGNCCIIDNNVTIPHDNIIEDGCHITPGVSMGSGIIIGKESIIGIGSSISTKVVIGKRVIVSVGSSVTRNIPDNAIVQGVPGRIIGERK